jgi:hypothetical protein
MFLAIDDHCLGGGTFHCLGAVGLDVLGKSGKSAAERGGQRACGRRRCGGGALGGLDAECGEAPVSTVPDPAAPGELTGDPDRRASHAQWATSDA